MAKKKTKEPLSNKAKAAASNRDLYVDNVRDALGEDERMSKDEYIDALEDILGEVQSLLDAARCTR